MNNKPIFINKSDDKLRFIPDFDYASMYPKKFFLTEEQKRQIKKTQRNAKLKEIFSETVIKP